jgi:Flp pilus assembly protein TadD
MTSRRQHIEAMLADEPNNPELRYMLAMEQASAGDDEGAAATFRNVIAIAPDYAPAYHMGGRALHRLGRISEARSLLTTGVAVALQNRNEHAAGEMQALLESLD